MNLPETYALPALITLIVNAFLMVVVADWRWLLGLLGVLYAAVMVLVSESWPVSIAVVKLIAGWMAVGMLALTSWSADAEHLSLGSPGPAGLIFRGLSAVLVSVSVISFFGEASAWFISASTTQLYGGLFLFGLGLIQLGMSHQPQRIIVGLLMVMAGFEILYATVEGSLLMTIFLGTFNLGIAFVGAYLLSVTAKEPG